MVTISRCQTAFQDSVLTSGSLVDSAGVNDLSDSNRHDAGDEEDNECVWMHVVCVVEK